MLCLLASFTLQGQQFNPVTQPSSQLADTVLDRPVHVAKDQRLVADFNGDGYSDLLWHYGRQTDVYRNHFNIWKFNSAGQPQTHYAQEQPSSGGFVIPVTGGAALDLINNTYSFIAGNFSGGSAAELIAIRNLSSPTTSGYQMLDVSQSNSLSAIMGHTSAIGFGNCKFFTPVVYKASKLIVGNFTGDNHDEILCLEFANPGTAVAHLLQLTANQFFPKSFTVGSIGGWNINWDPDEFHVGNFITSNDTNGNVKMELLCLNRSNGWLKIVYFDDMTSTWKDAYSNGGNANFFTTTQVSGGSSLPFSSAMRLEVGNFDAADSDVEVLITYGTWQAMKSIQWKSGLASFVGVKSIAVPLHGFEGVSQDPSPLVTAFERWSDRSCVKKFLGVCTKWTGDQHLQTREFFSSQRQVGPLTVFKGNFAKVNSGTVVDEELLMFGDSDSVVPNLLNNMVFLTSCQGASMTSGNCGSSIILYNLLGQQVNTFIPAENRLKDALTRQKTRYLVVAPLGDF